MSKACNITFLRAYENLEKGKSIKIAFFFLHLFSFSQEVDEENTVDLISKDRFTVKERGHGKIQS